MIVFKIIKAAVSLLLFLLNPMTWIHWSKSKERLHNELSWIWLKYHCFVLHKLSYPKIIRRISEKRRRGETVHVAFIVLSSSKWNSDSVYREFSNLPGYDTTVIVFPYLAAGKTESVKDTAEFFQKKGYRVEYGYNPEKGVYKSKAFWKDYDIVFFDDPYPQPPPVRQVLQVEVIGKYALTCYVPYGMFLCKNFEQTTYNLPNHSFAWKIFSELPWHKKQFAKYNDATGDSNVECLGYPKLDVYSQPLDHPECIWKSGLNPEVHRVIWAPHWTVNNQIFGQYSLFHLIYRQMLEYAEKHPETDWLFKPHPLLYTTVVNAGIMTDSQMDEYYQKWNSLPNGHVCLDGQFWDYFKTSDALITDSISFLIEYLPTKKPIFRLASNQSADYNEQTNQIIKDYYFGNCFEDVVSFIDEVVLNRNDYNYDKRMQALELLPNIGSAGLKIVQYINQQFEE